MNSSIAVRCMKGTSFKMLIGCFAGVLLQQILEVGAAGAEDHLMGLGVLAFCGNGHVTEGLLIPQVLE